MGKKVGVHEYSDGPPIAPQDGTDGQSRVGGGRGGGREHMSMSTVLVLPFLPG